MAKAGRFLYLYAYLAETGFSHIQSKELVQRLKHTYDVDLCYSIMPDETLASFEDASASVRQQVTSESRFLSQDYEILFIESRLNIRSIHDSEKVRAAILKQFLEGGGIVIFLFHGDYYSTSGDTSEQFLRAAGLPSLRHPRSKREFPDMHLVGHVHEDSLIYGYDEEHAISGDRRFIRLNIGSKYLQYISPQLHPIFSELTKIIVQSPVQVETSLDKILLTGNQTTTRMLTSDDLWWDGDAFFVFGCCRDIGNGCALTIAGDLFSDLVLAEEPSDNMQFMLNLVDYLLSNQRERRQFLALPIKVRQAHELASKALDSEDGDKEEIYYRFLERVTEYADQDIRVQGYRDDAEEFVQLALADYWNDLDELSRKFLITGEAAWRAFRGENFDFTVTSGPFAKALERELNLKVIDRFRQYLIDLGEIGSIIQESLSQLKSKQAPKFLRRCNPARLQEKPLTLGELRICFEETQRGSLPIYSRFNEYLVQQSSRPEFWLDADDFPQLLRTITERYRNGSAHTEEMPFATCKEWRALLLGLEGKIGVLSHVLSAAPISANL